MIYEIRRVIYLPSTPCYDCPVAIERQAMISSSRNRDDIAQARRQVRLPVIAASPSRDDAAVFERKAKTKARTDRNDVA